LFVKKKGPEPTAPPSGRASANLTSPTVRDHFRAYLWFLFPLLVILLWLFHAGFLPDQVQFSNDAPLGVYHSEWFALPSGFHGLWDDLNSIGINVGASSVIVSNLLRMMLGALWYSKIYPPITLLFLGSGAWLFFRCLKFSTPACTLGGLAAALNSGFFSSTCWGVGTQEIAIGFEYMALAAVVSSDVRNRWIKLALAGFAVGMGIMEGFDLGALFSLVVAAFTFIRSFTLSGSIPRRFLRGVGQVTLVAICAAFISAHTLSTLVNTQIKGIAGTEQDVQTKAQQWNFATQWSLPPRETLALIVPGLFGYRMDTPKNMEMFQQAYVGGNYWGLVGSDPSWDHYFANDRKGPPGQGGLRFTGGGDYSGTLVTLLAIWAAFQAFRKKDSVFVSTERMLLWFWTAVVVVSLLLALGRFAPFYQFVYALPFFSTIRNPTKYLHILSFAVVILFTYGVDGLSRRYLQTPLLSAAGFGARLKNWWLKTTAFDKRAVAGYMFVYWAGLFMPLRKTRCSLTSPIYTNWKALQRSRHSKWPRPRRRSAWDR
jgi:hypothetical protein